MTVKKSLGSLLETIGTNMDIKGPCVKESDGNEELIIRHWR